jgi:hypothetical protein
MVRKYETYTFSSAKFFADRGTEGVAQPLTERVNVSAVHTWRGLSLIVTARGGD